MSKLITDHPCKSSYTTITTAVVATTTTITAMAYHKHAVCAASQKYAFHLS